MIEEYISGTHHVLVAPAEALDRVSNVRVPLETSVSVVFPRRLPGVRALDEAEAGHDSQKHGEEAFHGCFSCCVYVTMVSSFVDLSLEV